MFKSMSGEIEGAGYKVIKLQFVLGTLQDFKYFRRFSQFHPFLINIE